AQGAAQFRRREVRRADRRALRRQEGAAHRDAGQVRGRAHRGRGRGSQDRRGEVIPGAGEEGRLSVQRQVGDVVLKLEGISLAFGGVKALSDISFDVREHEVRAIIGPNGAGKSSMLNVINGVYRPQQGTITFRCRPSRAMDTHDAAAHGIARTFQNIALFRGMTVLDNIMTGRNLKMKATFAEQAVWWGRARREELENRRKVEEVIDFLEIQHIRKT